MEYHLENNSERSHLIIPEYGRHVQKMVNHCVALEDNEERNKMAKAIVDVMGNLQPHLRDVPDFKHKLWDQLFIISDFKLDVESPYQNPQEKNYKKSLNLYHILKQLLNIVFMVIISRRWLMLQIVGKKEIRKKV